MIDTHCHLNDAKVYPDPAAEVAFAREQGVDQVIVIGTDPEDWTTAIALAERFDEVYAAVGWHPCYTAAYDGLAVLRPLLAHPKVVALGEIGLDYYHDHAPREIQHRAFREQLDLGFELDLPMVFHCRDAHPDFLQILEEYGPGRYLLHCFSGTAEDAARAASLGALFGVDGPVTYKNADALRDVLRTIPPDRLVVETDAPYLTPVPHRGQPNRPGYVRYVAEALAALHGVSPNVWTHNARRFFGLPGTTREDGA